MKIRKWLTLAFVMCFSVNTFAQASSKAVNTIQEQTVEQLSVEQAVKKAVDYSDKLKTIDENLEQAYDSYDSTALSYNLSEDRTEILNLATQLRTLSNQISNYKLNSQVEQALLELSVKEFFSDVINAQNQLELYEQNMVIAKKQMEIDRVKQELGLITDAEYNSRINEYNSKEMELRSKKVAIDNAFKSLNTVLGVDMDKRYELVLQTEYTPFEGDSLNYTVAKALSTAQSIIISQREYEIAQYKKENDFNSSSLSKNSNLRQSARSLSDTKLEVEKSVEDTYNQILTIEEDYTKNMARLKELEKEQEIINIKYELGKATEIDTLTAQYNIDSLKAEIENQIAEHSILVEKYNNPKLF